MNVLIADQQTNGLDFALRCEAAGHHVRLCLSKDKHTHLPSKVGDGLVEKIPGEEWEKSAKWADLILCTENTKWLPVLDKLKKRGLPVFAPSAEAARLEMERGRGQEFLAKHGINVMPYETFTDHRKAEKYLLANPDRYVSKPDGDKSKALSYVSKSPKDMLFMLRYWAERNKDIGKFILQPFVSGTEFAVAGWLGKEGFAQYIEESFEHKPLFNGDIGPNTGEQGTAIKYVADSALAKELLLPLEGDLIKMGATGSINVSCIVDENGEPRPLEFTCRLGWPAFNIVQPLHPDPCEWMVDLLDGRDTFRPLTDHAIGVVMTLYPWPQEKILGKDVSGIPIYNLDDDNPYRAMLSPCELQSGMAPNDDLVDERLMVSAGAYLVVATGLGDNVREAQREAYKAVDSIEVPKDLQYRTDIGDKLKKAIPALQQAGFAESWRY